MRFRLNLGALWELKRTVELGSITKAAEELGLSQPALTRRIKQMEHDLRVEVLVRDHAGVTPTDIGAMILERAQALFDQTRRLEEEIAAASGRLSGEVAVCMPTSMHQAVTRPFLRVAAEHMPDVSIRLIDAFDAILREQLMTGNADVGIFIHDADSSIPGLKLEPLFTDPLFLVGAGSSAGQRAAMRTSDLDQYRLVIPSQDNGLRRKLDTAFRRAKIKPEIIEVDSYRAMIDVVRSGRANTIAPSCSLTPSARSIWWAPITRLSIDWTFAVRECRMQSIAVRSAGDLLKKQVANWVERGVWSSGSRSASAAEKINRQR